MRSPKTPPAFLERLNLGALLRLVSENQREELAAHALARAVGELLEVEVEHRLTRGHVNHGHSRASPLAFAGMGGRDGTPGQSDLVANAAERHRGANAWRGLALSLLEELREPGQRAALVSAYLIRPTGAERRSPRMMTTAEAVRPENLATIYQRLGWPPRSGPVFDDAKTLVDAASYARNRMRRALAARLSAAVAAGHDPGSPCHE